MQLLNLANELLQSIADCLEVQRDINAFTQTNRQLHTLLNPYLYQHNIQRFGSSALLWAAKHGQEATAQILLAQGANIEATTDHGWTPLLLAATNGHGPVVKLLLAEDGVGLGYKDNDSRTPLS